MAEIVYPAPFRALDSNGEPVAAAEAYFYRTGTTTPLTVYADDAGVTAHPVPLAANSYGIFPAIFNTSAFGVKVDVQDPGTSTSLPGYPINLSIKSATTTGAASSVSFSPTATVSESTVQAAIESVDEDWRANATSQQATLDGLGTAAVADLIDEDNMASDSATQVPSQQSVKAYVDTRVIRSTTTISDDAEVVVTWTGSPREVRLVLQSVLPATDNVSFHCQFSNDGGSTWFGTAGDYEWFNSDTAHGTTNAQPASSLAIGTGANIQLSSTVNVGNAASEGASGELTLLDPHTSGQTLLTGRLIHKDNGGTFLGGTRYAMGLDAAEIDAVRFYFSAGNIASGTIVANVQY